MNSKLLILSFGVLAIVGCSSGDSPFIDGAGANANPGVPAAIPDQNSFSLSFSELRPEAWSLEGNTVDITIRVADRNNFAVPDGTVVNFKTTGGALDKSGCTVTNGSCTVQWIGQDPRPRNATATSHSNINNGQAYILAYTSGEESFIDTNGDDLFDAGDIFPAANDSDDAYVDTNDSGAFDAGDELVDLNGNGVYDGVDGLYNGPRCQNGAACTTTPIIVRTGGLLTMSDSYFVLATLAFENNQTTPFADKTSSIDFTLRDLNGNRLPTGTSLTVTATNGTIGTAPTFKENSADYTISVLWGAAGPFGLEIKTTAPSGRSTTTSPPL